MKRQKIYDIVSECIISYLRENNRNRNEAFPLNCNVYLDWLKDNGRQGTLSSSGGDIRKSIMGVLPSVYGLMMESENDDVYDDVNNYILFAVYWNAGHLQDIIGDMGLVEKVYGMIRPKVREFLSSYKTFRWMDCDEVYEWLPNIDEVREKLSISGKRYVYSLMFDRIKENGILDKLRTDGRGLVHIERKIAIPLDIGTDEYCQYLSKKNNIGDYWSLVNGGVYASDFGGKSTQVLINGYISPDDIDWKATFYVSASSWGEQTEAWIKNCEIEVDSIVFEDYGIQEKIGLLFPYKSPYYNITG